MEAYSSHQRAEVQINVYGVNHSPNAIEITVQIQIKIQMENGLEIKIETEIVIKMEYETD